jgi:short-subunit dehydrogenase
MDLPNSVVIVTGASQGIGKATAARFIESGAKVALVARSEDLLVSLAEELGHGRSLAIPADISQREACARVVSETVRRFGRIDMLVNNAGVGIYSRCETVAGCDVETVMDVNFYGALYMTQACIPEMKAGGGGLVINVSSIAGRRAIPNMGPYCASKAALERLMECWRMELSDDNIRFSSICPGNVQTGFKQNALGSHSQTSSPTKRLPVERVAEKVIQVAEREPRDAYVRLLDRAVVLGSRLFPDLFDRILARHYK